MMPLNALDGVDDADDEFAAAASFEELFELERDRLLSERIVRPVSANNIARSARS